MNIPLISVIMPVYNGANYLRQSIDSILFQTFFNFEFLIINDGSSDDTEDIILSYSDNRIRYFKNESNIKIVETLNKGISLSQGKYIARMDADDFSFANRLEIQLEYMENNPEVFVCGSWVKTFGAFERVWKYPVASDDIFASLLFHSPIAHPSVLVRREVYEKFLYDGNYVYAEDYKLWHLIAKEYKIVNIPNCLLKYRITEEQTRSLKIDDQLLISNQIRKEILIDFGLNFDLNEIEIHNSLGSNKKIDFLIAEKWLHKIFLHNQQVNFFNNSSLNILISKIWHRVLSHNADIGLKIFYYYIFKSKLNFHYSFKLISTLFVRCFFKLPLRCNS